VLDDGAGERILVDFFYAQPVGHVIEALHHCRALHRADPSREISLMLNAAAPTELTRLCPLVAETFAIAAPFVEAAPDAEQSLQAVPRVWDRVLDDPRRHQAIQLEMFAGMRDHYAASDRRFTAREARGVLGSEPPSRARHEQLRLCLPDGVRRSASLHVRDGTASTLSAAEHERLMSHPFGPVDMFDVALFEQLAVVELADVFLAPHTGFGMAALAVGTPWLAVSGGRWFEWYFNRVPFSLDHPRHDALPLLFAVRRRQTGP
jgi:hypothetical protein